MYVNSLPRKLRTMYINFKQNYITSSAKEEWHIHVTYLLVDLRKNRYTYEKHKSTLCQRQLSQLIFIYQNLK